jgi:hypothetical protein
MLRSIFAGESCRDESVAGKSSSPMVAARRVRHRRKDVEMTRHPSEAAATPKKRAKAAK